MRSGEPKCSSSARFRTGPTPRSSSSTERVIAWSRRLRWKSIANRCASSRTRCSSRRRLASRAAISSGCRATGDEDLLEALGEADHRARRARRSGPSARIPAESWPLPPSITIRSGSEAKLSSRSASCGERSACSSSGRRRRPSTSSIEAKSSGPRGAVPADPEPAVVGLLRRAALEDDHRGDRVLAADVGDVEALDPDRQRVESRARPAARRARRRAGCGGAPGAAGPGRAPATRCASASSRSRRLVAALGDPDLDRAAAPSRERLGEHGARSRSAWPTTTSRGHRRRRGVVLGEELLGHLGLVALGRVGEVEAVALGEDPVADLEDLRVGLGALDRDSDQVGVVERLAGDAAALHQRAHGLEPVA